MSENFEVVYCRLSIDTVSWYRINGTEESRLSKYSCSDIHDKDKPYRNRKKPTSVDHDNLKIMRESLVNFT